MRTNYGALPEGLFCADSLQFLSVAQLCEDAPTALDAVTERAQTLLSIGLRPCVDLLPGQVTATSLPDHTLG